MTTAANFLTLNRSIEGCAYKIRKLSSILHDSHLAFLFLQFYFFQQEMQGNSFIMLIAGYETTSTALGLASYELALNRDVQDKLQAEIDQHFPDKVQFRFIDVVGCHIYSYLTDSSQCVFKSIFSEYGVLLYTYY